MNEDCGMGCVTTLCVDACGGDGNADDECVEGCLDEIEEGMEEDDEEMTKVQAKATKSKRYVLR